MRALRGTHLVGLHATLLRLLLPIHSLWVLSAAASTSQRAVIVLSRTIHIPFKRIYGIELLFGEVILRRRLLVGHVQLAIMPLSFAQFLIGLLHFWRLRYLYPNLRSACHILAALGHSQLRHECLLSVVTLLLFFREKVEVVSCIIEVAIASPVVKSEIS